MSDNETKPVRRMTCWNCPRYSRSARRCAEGKANPKSKSDSVAVAEALGLRALCHYNPYRDALAMRMFFPNASLTIHLTEQSRRSKRMGKRTLPPGVERGSSARGSTGKDAQ